jgi:serine O-acetyltransferase
LFQNLRNAMDSNVLELGHTMRKAIREDALAVCRRDPAMDNILQVVLMSKGYAALVAHRAAFRLFAQKKRFTALFLQSQASAAFGLDIHPCAQIGIQVMFDHGTGIVIGETATVGDGTTLLHGVTLGGTGKVGGDRHPKVGRNVLIGAGCSILGNIHIGCGAKIGAGSVVLRSIPRNATAVGAPARIIGRAMESSPGSDVDASLMNFKPLHATKEMQHTAARRLSGAGLEIMPEMGDDELEEKEDTEELACPLCPWRQYAEMAKLAPPHSVTISTMCKLLEPEGCTMEEIGNCFFDLDTETLGYVLMPVFSQRATNILLEYTKLPAERVEGLLADFFKKFGESSLRKSMLGPESVLSAEILKSLGELKEGVDE